MINIGKNVFNKLIVMLVSFVLVMTTFTVQVTANSGYKFELTMIDYDLEGNKWNGKGDKTSTIPDGSKLKPGQIIQVDLDYVEGPVAGFAGAQLVLEFDDENMEIIHMTNNPQAPLLTVPRNTRDNPIFPDTGWDDTTWSQTLSFNENGHLQFLYAPGTDNMSVTQKGTITTFFLRVKEDAVPNTQLNIDFFFSPNANLSSSLSVGGVSTSFEGKGITSTVEGEAVEENNLVTDIKVQGSTGSGTYDYLSNFDNEGSSFNMIVPPSVSSLTFSHTLEDPSSGTVVRHGKTNQGGSSISGMSLTVGDNYFLTTVSNSSGEVVKQYNYVVKRLSNNTNFDVTGSDQEASHYFFGTHNELTVKSTTEWFDVRVSSEDANAEVEFEVLGDTASGTKVTIDTTKSTTLFTLKMKAEDMLSKYDNVPGINDNRSSIVEKEFKLHRASDDNSLKSVTISDFDTDLDLKTWTDSLDEYVLEVSNEVKKIKLSIETNHEDAQIMSPGWNEKALQPGLNTHLVEVNAPDGTKKIYTFKITRKARSNAELSSLSVKVNGVEQNPNMNSVQQVTNIELDFEDVLNAEIFGVANTAMGATLVSGNTSKSLDVGLNTFTLKVRAEDGTTELTYTLNITVKQNGNSDVEGGINPNPGTGDENWLEDPNNPIEDESLPGGETDENDNSIKVYRYNINVQNSKKKFGMADLDIKLPSNATLGGGTEISLNVGDNTFTFDIKSQDGQSTSRYIITVNRAKNKVAKVDEIKVTSTPMGTLSGSLLNGFIYKVGPTVTKYHVEVVVSDGTVVDQSTVGEFDLLDSEQTHTVKVTSEDGSTTKEYEVTIERTKSTDASLKSILVTYGIVVDNDLIGSFVNNRYTLKVGNDVESVDIKAITNHPNAHFTINNTSDIKYELNYGSNLFNIAVTSETGAKASYALTVERALNDDALLNELNIDDSLLPGFSVDNFEYTIGDVAEDVTELDITYVTSDSNATVKIKGNKLVYGDNIVEVVVTAQDGKTTKTYKINVYRELSSSADLGEDGVIAEDGNHTVEKPDNDAVGDEKYRYKVYVPYETKKYGKDDFTLDLPLGSTVSYEQDEITLSRTEKNEYKFIVTAASGNQTQEYIIEVIIMDSNVPKLIEIAINGTVYTSFNPDEYSPVIQLDNLISSADETFIFTVKAPSGVNVAGYNEEITVTGKQIIEQDILLTRLADAMTTTYKFKFTRTLSSEHSLTLIEVDKGTLSPVFEETVLTYEVRVGGEVDKIEVSATPANPNAKVTGAKEYDLIPGKNLIKVSVNAEDNKGSTHYDIVVYRALALDSLSLGETELTNGVLSGDGKTLTFTVPGELDTSLTEGYVKAVANHESVKFVGQVNKDVVLDNSDIKFTMLAQDGETELDVVIKYDRALSDDARLKDLKLNINDTVLSPDFDPDTYEYQIFVEHDFLKFERDKHLEWEVMHLNTVVTAPESMTISNTEVNVYEIVTLAEDGVASKTYTLNIIRGTYNFLENLRIADGQGHFEQDFDKMIFEYDALVYPSQESFSFMWTLKTGVTVQNASSLKNISTDNLPNTFDIEVIGDTDEVRIYKVNVSLGTSTRLKTMEASQGILDFKPGVYEYTVPVSLDTTVVSLINITTEDPNATVPGNFTNLNLTGESTTFEVVVHNDGIVGDPYKVTFIKTQDLAGIDGITANDGKNIWDAELNEDGKYEITVDNETNLDDLEFNVKTDHPGSKVEIEGPIVNENGDHEYTITVEDENGIKKDYDLVVKNDESDNSYLKSLEVNGEKVTGFNKFWNTYDFKLSSGENFEVEAIAEDENASVEIDYTEPLNNGDVVKITVTSQKGSSNIYTITIVRDKENTATLDDLSIKEAQMLPKYNKLQSDYYVRIPYERESLTFVYTANGAGSAELISSATVDGNVVSDLPVGETIVEVKVTAEDQTVHSYYVNVTRGKKADNYLDELVVSDLETDKQYTLSPKFNKDNTAYSLNIPYGSNGVLIEAEYRDGLSVVGLGEIPITNFPYVHEIRVIDENNELRTYTIIIDQDASEKTFLSDLTTNEGGFDTVFTADKTSYTKNVAYEVTEIEILYTSNIQDQVVMGDGLKSLEVGSNVFEVIVSSGSSSRTYTIHINRAKGTPKLDWLEVDEGELSPEFNPDTYVYNVDVESDIEEISINAGSSKDSLTVTGGGVKTLEDGTQVFEIVVDADFGETRTYYVIVNKEPEQTNPSDPNDPFAEDVTLAYLDIIGEEMNEEFDKNLREYSATLSQSEYELLDILAIPTNPNAKVKITGHANLGLGEHVITIRVSLSSELFQETTITVTIEPRALESDIHVVGDARIDTVKPNTTVADMKDQMLNENDTLKIYFEGVEQGEDELVATGSIIKLVINDVEYDSKIIVIKGDVNGDGEIGIADRMQTQGAVLGETLTDIQAVAADVSDDGIVAVNDYMMIQSHILQILDIHAEGGDSDE